MCIYRLNKFKKITNSIKSFTLLIASKVYKNKIEINLLDDYLILNYKIIFRNLNCSNNLDSNVSI